MSTYRAALLPLPPDLEEFQGLISSSHSFLWQAALRCAPISIS